MTTPGYIVVFGYLTFILWLVYSGQKAGWPANSQRVFLWGLAPGVFMLVLVVGIALSNQTNNTVAPEPPGVPGVDPNATRIELRDISAALVTADKKGDVQVASLVIAAALNLTVKIESQPDFKRLDGALRNCSLASRNLLNGAELVAKGGRWLNQDQFQAAVADCRT
jgi:hypothetical protein